MAEPKVGGRPVRHEDANARFTENNVDMTLDMRNHWYPIALSKNVNNNKPEAQHILGDPIVIYRDKHGKAVVLADKCAHRSAPLSVGEIHDGFLECKYHGWQYDASGKVTKIPALPIDRPIPANAFAYCYPTAEEDELVWVWPGDPARASETPVPCFKPGSGKGVYGEDNLPSWSSCCTSQWDMDIDHSLMVENLLDPAHVDFLHTKTIGKRKRACPMVFEMIPGGPDRIVGLLVRSPQINTTKFVFTAPCHIQIQIELRKGWFFHQAIHCVPTSKGHMRMIHRQSRTFLTWLSPVFDFFGYFERAANKVVWEDYSILRGQQNRLRQGAKEWHSPIPVDFPPKLYRAWWGRVMRARQLPSQSGPHTVSKAPGPWFKGFASDIEDMNFAAIHYAGGSGFGADCSGCDLSEEPEPFFEVGDMRGRVSPPKIDSAFGFMLSNLRSQPLVLVLLLATAMAAAARWATWPW